MFSHTLIYAPMGQLLKDASNQLRTLKQVAGKQFKAEFLPADVPVPGGNILVGEPRGDIEHDDRTLAIDAAQLKHMRKILTLLLVMLSLCF